MAKTIKGINVVIGSDVTPLGKALQDVNKHSKDIATELRKVAVSYTHLDVYKRQVAVPGRVFM